MPVPASIAVGPTARGVLAQLPADVPDFTCRVRELSRLDRLLAEVDRGAATGTEPSAVAVAAVSGTAGVGKPDPGI